MNLAKNDSVVQTYADMRRHNPPRNHQSGENKTEVFTISKRNARLLQETEKSCSQTLLILTWAATY